MLKNKDRGNEIQTIIKQLKEFDERKAIDKNAESIMLETLVAIGKPAVSSLIEVLNTHDTWMSSAFAADVLGEIGDTRAIQPLADALEDFELGKHAYRALKKFGAAGISDVIQRIEYRIAHPITTGTSRDLITAHALKVVGEVHCAQSIKFLNKLLDDYVSEMPDESFDPTTHNWKYRNVDFFHLLDCMVRQQDTRAIPHIRKARDCFPEEYTDYKICQIAIGRIQKGKVEGYLPMEAMEICMPSGRIMDALSGGEYDWEDTFDQEYGEYFDVADELEAVCFNCNQFFPASMEPTEFGLCLSDKAFEPFLDELLENPGSASCQELIHCKKFSGEQEACPDFEEMEQGIEIDENSPLGVELSRLIETGELNREAFKAVILAEQAKHIDWKTMPVEQYLTQLKRADPKVQQRAVSGLGSLIALGHMDAFNELFVFFKQLASPTTIEDVHFKIEVLRSLRHSSTTPLLIPQLIDELYQTSSNNTTRQWIAEIFRFLECCPREEIREPLEKMLRDKRFSPRLKKKMKKILSL